MSNVNQIDAECSTVQRSNVQSVFVVIEEQTGVLQKPVPESLILPAGRASITQSPTFTDSPELAPSLDVVSQSRDSMPPGDFSIPMVIRLAPDAGAPQGDPLLRAAMGGLDTTTDPDVRQYYLEKCRPTVSIWINNDGTGQFMSGCVVEQIEWPVELDGLTTFTFSGRGRRSGVVGVGTLAEAPAETSIKLESGQSMAFSVGGYITNTTKPVSEEYQITAIDTATDTLVLDNPPADWVAGESIGPWFPVGVKIGSEVENNSITMKLDGVTARMRPSTWTASLPTQFLQEVGDMYPGEGADNKRSVTMDVSVYFRAAEAVRFGQTLEGKEMPAELTAANKNGSITVSMPRGRLSSPEIGEDDAVLTLDSTYTALGTDPNKNTSFSISIR